MTDSEPERRAGTKAQHEVVPPVGWRILAGVVSALAAIGAGHGVAALLNPGSSPLIVVGSTLIDAAPTPAKEFAVRTFGTADKPILIGSVGIVVLIFAAVLGHLAWRRRTLAVVGISLLGAVGVIAAAVRPDSAPVNTLPSLLAGIIGVIALDRLSRIGARPVPGTSGEARVTRRALIIGIGLTGAIAGVTGGGGALINQVKATSSDLRRRLTLPRPASAAPSIPPGAQLPKMTPFSTSNDAFYRVDIALVTPRISVEDWTLTIDGMVDTPLTVSYDELLELPMIERDITLTCVSNEVGGPYVGTARWLGVPFTEIIKRVGVHDDVDQVFSHSLDQGYTCSTPYQAVSDGRDAMIVVGMNGEVLPDKNGFPARMLVPGLFGFVSATKWLERIEFTRYDLSTAYWTEREWATDAPILTQSRIDVPRSLKSITRDQPILAGVAWAQQRGVAKVEIRIDGGPWQSAKLADEAGIDLWRQWSFVHDGPPGRHTAEVRATDQSGHTQPEKRTKVFPSGAQGWHQIQFTQE